MSLQMPIKIPPPPLPPSHQSSLAIGDTKWQLALSSLPERWVHWQPCSLASCLSWQLSLITQVSSKYEVLLAPNLLPSPRFSDWYEWDVSLQPTSFPLAWGFLFLHSWQTGAVAGLRTVPRGEVSLCAIQTPKTLSHARVKESKGR